MNLEIVEISSCKKNLVAEVPADQVEEEIEQAGQQYAQQAKVPGFRPGKVPLTIIRQRFARRIAERRDPGDHQPHLEGGG